MILQPGSKRDAKRDDDSRQSTYMRTPKLSTPLAEVLINALKLKNSKSFIDKLHFEHDATTVGPKLRVADKPVRGLGAL